LETAKTRWLDPNIGLLTAHVDPAIHVLLDLHQPACTASQNQNTPTEPPPDMDMDSFPPWALQPLVGDLHQWFDLPTGLFHQSNFENDAED
jgi:hypothetical protein